MRRVWIAGLLLGLSLFLYPKISGSIEKKAIKVIHKQYKPKNFERGPNPRWTYWTFDTPSHRGYRAVVFNVKGRTKPITLLLVLSPSDKVDRLEILKYRVQYGRQVRSRKWLNQFKGASLEWPLKIGQDIDALSGATYSTHAITKGVKDMLDKEGELN